MSDTQRAQALQAKYPPAQKFALYRIATIVNDLHDLRWFMTNDKLAAEIGVTRQTVSGWMADFVADGWLKVLRAPTGGRSRAGEYRWVSLVEIPVGQTVGSPDSNQTVTVGSTANTVGLTDETVGSPDTQVVREETEKRQRLIPDDEIDRPEWHPSARNTATAREMKLDDATIERVRIVINGLDITRSKAGAEFVTRCSWEARAIARTNGAADQPTVGERALANMRRKDAALARSGELTEADLVAKWGQKDAERVLAETGRP